MMMQTASSQKSFKSGVSQASSARYRRKQGSSIVQEELFGKPASTSRPRTIGKQVGPETATISVKQLKELKESLKLGKTNNATVISENELAKIRKAATVRTKHEILEDQRTQREQQVQAINAARSRRQRILKKEEERQRQAALSDIELENIQKRQFYRQRAEEIKYEHHDDVKDMNQMCLYAKCVTVRDGQIHEKKKAVQEVKADQERLDLVMEIERLKQIKFFDEREARKKVIAKNGARVIEDQIKERDLVRIKENEEKIKEGQDLLKEILRQQEEEAIAAQLKKEKGARLLDEVEEANRLAVIVKEKMAQAEIDEDLKIIEYQKNKAAQEQAWIEEQERLKAEKEREVQRLREMQERAADRQEELDSLRAKRATEAQERAAREKERQEALRLAKINAELQEARLQQAREKDIRLALVAKQEKEEFNRIIEAQKEEIQIEQKQEEQKHEMRVNHASQLINQINVNEELRKQQRRDQLEEIIVLKQAYQEEKNKLLSIKERKMQDLKNNRIPDKYQYDLAKKKVAVDF